MGIKPVLSTVTITTAGTRVQVSSTDVFCSRIRFEADGTSTIYVGDSTVASTKFSAKIIGGGSPTFWELVADGQSCVNETMMNLKFFYVDAGANGAKVHVTYFDRMGSF